MRTHDIQFGSAGCTLAGTFAEAASPVAAALLITGSGRVNRDSDARLPAGRMLRAGITRAIAEALAQSGVSSLRYDKRGVGTSGGDYWSTGMPQRLADARAALAWLAERAPGIPLLVIGHSEGAYHAASLAADGSVAGAVLVSGSARTGGEVLAWQTRQIAATLPAATRLVLRLLRTDAVKAQQKNQARIMASSDDVMRLQGTKVAARWFRDFISYDPAPVLRQIGVPVLAVTGGHDLQVPPDDIETIGTLVQGPYTGRVVGDLSHLLRSDPGPAGLRGYLRSVREPVSPEVLGLITAWVSCHWAPR
jgi:alpha/beta superfamily hydrolase